MNNLTFKEKLEEYRLKVESAIDKYLPNSQTRPAIIHEAMLYSMKIGGKRIRPILILAGRELFESDLDPMPACVAIEALHTYSLIHDDLPCMDNADLRRGKASCHKQFDEAIALLAGDALLTFAFELLAKSYAKTPEVAASLVAILAEAGNSMKMIGGQVEDVLGERDGVMTAEKLDFIHHNKTAALITASVCMGLTLTNDCNKDKLDSAKLIGKNIGLAFQIIDDILDVVSDAETMGKTVGLDATNNKMTYVSIHGIEKSRQIAADLTDEAMQTCKNLSDKSDFLCDFLTYLKNRIN